MTRAAETKALEALRAESLKIAAVATKILGAASRGEVVR